MNVYTKIPGRAVGMYQWDQHIKDVVPGDIVYPYPQVIKTAGEKSYSTARADVAYFVVGVERNGCEINVVIMAPDCSFWEIMWQTSQKNWR